MTAIMLLISKKAEQKGRGGAFKEHSGNQKGRAWEAGVSDLCSIPPPIDLGNEIGEVEVKNLQPVPSAAKSANLRLVLPLLMENKCRIIL